MDNAKTGKLIRALRTEKGITQKELAEKIQVSNAAVSKWENGHGFPDISLLEPLSEALDISISELITGERNLNTPEKNENNIIKDIIQLSEYERKHRNAKQSMIIGCLILLILITGCIGIQYLWRTQNEPIPIPTSIIAIAPLFFGLMAWNLAIINIFRTRKHTCNHFSVLSAVSFLCCAIAIWIPILDMDLLVRNHETGTIQDLVWGYNFASIFLLMITVILNLLAYHVYKNKQ